jgi:hypothetical protein
MDDDLTIPRNALPSQAEFAVRIDAGRPDANKGVGYRHPQRHGRFEPGRSGNPRGRPRGVLMRSPSLHGARVGRLPLRIDQTNVPPAGSNGSGSARAVPRLCRGRSPCACSQSREPCDDSHPLATRMITSLQLSGRRQRKNQTAAPICLGEPQPLRAAAYVFAVAEIPPSMIALVEGGIFTSTSISAFPRGTAFQSPMDGLDPRHYAISRFVEPGDMAILCTGRTDNRSESQEQERVFSLSVPPCPTPIRLRALA